MSGELASGQIHPWKENPDVSINKRDQLVHGHDCQRHPVLGFIIERGSGALSVEQQAQNYLWVVERDQGKEAADVLRLKLAGKPARLKFIPGSESRGD